MKHCRYRILFFIAGGLLCCAHAVHAKEVLSYDEMIRRTAKKQDGIHITVGIISKEGISFKVYGENGIEETAAPVYEYEIGSLSKTFTTSLLAKAVSEQRISLDDTIDKFLPLKERAQYPTILQLATHTAGYGSIDHAPMLLNAMKCRNPLMDFNRAAMVKLVERKNQSRGEPEWEYSNFGIAVLGCTVADSCNSSYAELTETYIQKDLRLQHTRIGNGKGNLSPYWDWNRDDVYIAAGGLVSTILDMMEYARVQMKEEKEYLVIAHQMHLQTDHIDLNGAIIDGVGLGWMIDNTNDILWHDGGTDNFNSYLGFNRDKNIAVVVLSNTPDDFRYSARDIGAKLLLSLISQK